MVGRADPGIKPGYTLDRADLGQHRIDRATAGIGRVDAVGLTDGQLVSNSLTTLARVSTESAVRPGSVTVRVQELDRRLCANLRRESVLPRAMRDARGELILDPCSR